MDDLALLQPLDETHRDAVLQLAVVVELHVAVAARDDAHRDRAVLRLLCGQKRRRCRIAVRARVDRDLRDRLVQLRERQLVMERLGKNRIDIRTLFR